MTLYFLHIPRTGGTALRSALTAAFGPENVLALYTKDGAETSPAAREIFHADHHGSLQERLAALSEYITSNNVALFTSHVQMTRMPCFDPDAAFVILRDPVSRALSEYRYLRYTGAFDGSVSDYLSSDLFQNVQSRIVGRVDLDEIAVVGVFERYGQFVERLNQRFGLDLEVDAENETRLLSRLYLPRCGPSLRAKIEAANRKDLALYERARRLTG